MIRKIVGIITMFEVDEDYTDYEELAMHVSASLDCAPEDELPDSVDVGISLVDSVYKEHK